MKTLLIIGAGGHGQVVAETAKLCGYSLILFLDDLNPLAAGKTCQLEELAKNYDGVIVSIGNNNIRRDFFKRLSKIDAEIVSIIHPRAYVSSSAKIETGSIILPNSVIHTNARIGKACIISIGALVDHDAIVDDFSHINAGAIVAAGEKVGGKIEGR